MDDEWKSVYEENALKDVPIHSMSCWSKQGFEELFKITFKLVKKLKNVKNVLDVGCGPGVYSSKLNELGYEVTGADYSKNVISKAKKDYPKINFLVADAKNLPFKKDSFDLVLCIGVLQCVYDAEKIIDELTRTSSKYILISTLLRKTKYEDPTRFLQKKLETDSWPTHDYHPSELEDLLDKKGFFSTVILKNNGKIIEDGFFILATKK